MQKPSISPNTGPYQLSDPRDRQDFQLEYYPTADGKEAPGADASRQNDRIKAEFCAVYYELNRLYAQLLDVRNTSALAEKKAAERQALQAIEEVLICRDALEDRYAPMGVIAEPIVERGFTKDLRCSFGDVDAAGRRRSELYTITTYVPVPLPENVRFEDLPVKIEGPGLNPDPGVDA